jgi:hypothetical protein
MTDGARLNLNANRVRPAREKAKLLAMAQSWISLADLKVAGSQL